MWFVWRLQLNEENIPGGNMMVLVPSRGLKRNLNSRSVLEQALETSFQVVYEIMWQRHA